MIDQLLLLYGHSFLYLFLFQYQIQLDFYDKINDFYKSIIQTLFSRGIEI